MGGGQKGDGEGLEEGMEGSLGLGCEIYKQTNKQGQISTWCITDFLDTG